MKITHSLRRLGGKQSGFTMVELMVGMVLGLFIVLALITLLINVNRNNSELTKMNRVIENGRFAMYLLQQDLAHGGFWGGYVPAFEDLTFKGAPGDVPTFVPDPCLDYSVANWTQTHTFSLVGLPVQSYSVGTATLPVCAAKVTNAKQATDVLVVRHAEPCVAGPVPDSGCTDAAAAPSANEVFLQFPRCGNTSSPNYISTSFVLGPPTIPTPGATPYQRDCVTPAQQFRFSSHLYYVRSHSVTPGDGIPTLMRAEFRNGTFGNAESLVEGVEGFRVEFGIDSRSDAGVDVTPDAVAMAPLSWADNLSLTSPTNRGDGTPDDQGLGNGAYIRCDVAGVDPCTVNRLRNTVAVKIFVLVRAESSSPGHVDKKTYTLGSAGEVGPFNDGFKRRLFVQTVRLTNVSGRRETP